MKFYWCRLTEAAAKNLTSNGADKFIDPDLKRRYLGEDTKLETKKNTIYTYKLHEWYGPKGGYHKEKQDYAEFCTILSCSTFYNTKGVGYFDNEYKGEYCIVLDEMNREESEKNNFDIVYNFVNLIENIARSTKTKIKVIMIGNTLDEASDILCAFNFLPDGFGRFKLKSKRCVIDYIMPNEAYLERRKGTVANLLMPNASTFTNEVQVDRTLLVNKRLAVKPVMVLAFGRTKDTWFTLYNNNIIKHYNGERKQIYGMKMYLDALYNDKLVGTVFELWNSRNLKFVNLSTLKSFQKQLKLLKPSK